MNSESQVTPTSKIVEPTLKHDEDISETLEERLEYVSNPRTLIESYLAAGVVSVGGAMVLHYLFQDTVNLNLEIILSAVLAQGIAMPILLAARQADLKRQISERNENSVDLEGEKIEFDQDGVEKPKNSKESFRKLTQELKGRENLNRILPRVTAISGVLYFISTLYGHVDLGRSYELFSQLFIGSMLLLNYNILKIDHINSKLKNFVDASKSIDESIKKLSDETLDPNSKDFNINAVHQLNQSEQ